MEEKICENCSNGFDCECGNHIVCELDNNHHDPSDTCNDFEE